ncbi:MAG: hypothetical protein QXQ61_00135 [Candidatus Bathyarchaeia archaeon]
MGKLLKILKDKRVHYVVIVWILLVKAVEIVAGLLAEIEPLRFFEILGFGYLSTFSRMVWDALVALTIAWLIYRLKRDVFQISLKMGSLSKLDVLSITLLFVWVISSATAILQFAQIASLPPASPQLEVSKYYTPCSTANDRALMYFAINDTERGAKITLDLSKSMFTAPFSFYGIGEISMFGVKNGGLSYFSLRNSSIGQKIIEMKFFGNGTDGLNGWSANKILLEKPLKVNESTTLMLMLKLEPSSDNTAWTYIKLDFSSNNGEEFSLVWKFHDKPINSMFHSADNKMRMYLLGSAVEWTFFQFTLPNIFYTSFSSHPQFLNRVEYGVGAEADNTVTANFLLAKITDYPLKVNGELIEEAKPTVKVGEDSRIRLEGVNVSRLYVTSILKPCKEKRHFQLFLTKISRLEQYEWNIFALHNKADERIRFNFTNNSAKIFLNGREVVSKTSFLDLSTVESAPLQDEEVILTVVNEIDTYLMPTISICLVPLLILCLWKKVKSKVKTENEYVAFHF